MAKKKTTKKTKSTKTKSSRKSTKAAKKPKDENEEPGTKPTSVKKTKKKKVVEPKEVEVIAVGEDDDEDDVQDTSDEDLEKSQKWWLQEPFRSLLDPELASSVDFAKFDLSALIDEFTEKMLKEDLIDFRISGLAIYSSSVLYHRKITDVIKEEEHIEQEKKRERLRREVPKAIAQPLSESRKLATSEELFGAMRRAIIETMQKREKLKIRREKQQAKKEKKIIKKGKGKLPAEILKHVTGKSETIEQRLQKWQAKLKTMSTLSGSKIISMKEIKDMIYNEQEELFTKKVKYINAFEAMLFLASLNKIILRQETMKSPIDITVLDTTKIELND